MDWMLRGVSINREKKWPCCSQYMRCRDSIGVRTWAQVKKFLRSSSLFHTRPGLLSGESVLRVNDKISHQLSLICGQWHHPWFFCAGDGFTAMAGWKSLLLWQYTIHQNVSRSLTEQVVCSIRGGGLEPGPLCPRPDCWEDKRMHTRRTWDGKTQPFGESARHGKAVVQLFPTFE